MSKQPLNKKEVLDYLYSLPLDDFTKIVKGYDKKHKSKIQEQLDLLYTSELEKKLFEAGVNSACPICHSSKIVKRGRTSNFQRYKCEECNNSFTSVSGTFLEKTKFSWKAWVKIVELTINGYSIVDTVNILEKDFNYSGITETTVLLARHKILYAISKLPQPILTGVIQIDETFFRESQKASRNLENYIPSVAAFRKPRYGEQSSLLGVMGSEFATVPVAIDSTGHVVAKVACLGRLTIEIFTDLFHDHLDKPSYICTDANPIYKRYCRVFGIPHYIRPSSYLADINKAGYDQPLYPDERLNADISEQNHKILEKLYTLGISDRIVNKGYLTFKEFEILKRTYGLNLANVNQQHNELKKLINVNMTNVSTKFLDRYISLYVFLHNWGVDHKHYPSSSADAEEILIYILQNTHNTVFTYKDFKETKLILPKPTTKYIDLLASMTSEARKEFNSRYLKFNEEDKVFNFKKREYLLDCPRSWLEEVARQRGIPYRHKSISTWDIVSNLLKQEDIDVIIVYLLLKDKKVHIEQEDADLLEYFKLNHMDLSYDIPSDDYLKNRYPPVREDSPLYNPNAYFTAQELMDYQESIAAGKAIDIASDSIFEEDGDDTLPF